jgi:uncharacterized protein involved in exopolysaccharide biosynthesis
MNHPKDFSSIVLLVKNAAKHQWGKALLFFVGSLGLILTAMMFWGNSYRSDARLFLRLGRESVSIDPTVSESGAITVNEGREIEINSVLQILGSRELAERVVQKLGDDLILSGVLPSERQPSSFSPIDSLKSTLRVLLDGSEVSLHERAVTALLKGLKVTSPKKTSVVCIQYDSRSPEVAQMVVNEVIDAFKTEHLRINSTAGSYEFLAKQTQLLEEKLLAAQNELRDSKNRSGLVSINGHKQVLQDEFALLETQLINVRSDLSGSKARLKSLEMATDQLPERQETDQVQVAVDSKDKMREKLYDLQIKEREVTSKFSKDHPVHQAIAEQVREAQVLYDSQVPERGQKTTGINSARQQIDLARHMEKADHDSHEAKYSAMQTQYEAATQRMKDLNMDEVHLADLQRKVDQAEVAFKTYSEKMEQARLEQQLESQRISNINVIQAASFVEKPASPNRLLMLALGFVFASSGGIGIALLVEMLAYEEVGEWEDSEESIYATPSVKNQTEPVRRKTYASVTLT